VRDYSKVEPKMWHGATMKALRKQGHEAVIVAMYLMTSPSSNMLGLYCQPILYMAHETGLGLEGASKGLARCVDAGFCAFDAESEMVWVVEMARYQIADKLKPGDLRCKGVQREYESLPDNPFLGEFYERYAECFRMTGNRGAQRSSMPLKSEEQAPCKPLASQEQEQEHEQEHEQEQEQTPSVSIPRKSEIEGASGAKAPATTRGTRLPKDWVLPRAWGEWALAEFPSWSADAIRIEGGKFRDFWCGKSGKDATKIEWDATWRNWCRNAKKPTAQRQSPMDVAAEAARILGHDADETGEVIDA
jgi:hypothetical protein